MLLPHPAVQILMWLALAAAVTWLGPPPLAGLTLAPLLAAGAAAEFLRLLRRLRWLLLSLLLIYAWITPGTAIWPAGDAWSPTWEGLAAGLAQVLRLTALLAALALLVTRNGRDAILGGLWLLLRPIGAARAERIAARIWLTLYYAERPERRDLAGWWREAHAMLAPEAPAAMVVRLEVQSARPADLGLLAGWVALLAALVWLT